MGLEQHEISNHSANKIFVFLKISSLSILLVLVILAMKYFKSQDFKAQMSNQQSSMNLLFGGQSLKSTETPQRPVSESTQGASSDQKAPSSK